MDPFSSSTSSPISMSISTLNGKMEKKSQNKKKTKENTGTSFQLYSHEIPKRSANDFHFYVHFYSHFYPGEEKFEASYKKKITILFWGAYTLSRKLRIG